MNSHDTSHLLTIGMPVYNDLLFLEQAIQSILSQSYSNFILIISDDCSTDGSNEVCEKYSLADERIQYIRLNANIGISRNMEYLLEQSQSKYFMWAADDDLWAPDFIERLIAMLESNPCAIVAFCNYQEIDEKGNILGAEKCFNYSNLNKKKRVQKFIQNSDDQFGYGVFVTSRIKSVKFPIWWWPNRDTSYNNIFPTLCYYLSKGNYAHYGEHTLFYKRVKTVINMNHVLTGRGYGLKEILAYMIRRFNLIMFSSNQILRADGVKLMLQIFPFLFHYWFIKSSMEQLSLAGKSFWKNRLLGNNNIEL